MSNLVLILLLCIVSLTLGQKYNTKYDNIDIERILSSKRVLNNYIKCIIDEGPCTAEGRELKEHIPEAITTNCAKCSPAQVKIIRRATSFIMKTQPQDWERVKNKYDPDEKYKEQFLKFVNGN